MAVAVRRRAIGRASDVPADGCQPHTTSIMTTTSIRRHIAAPRAAAFRALLDPAAIARWRVRDGMSATVHGLGWRTSMDKLAALVEG